MLYLYLWSSLIFVLTVPGFVVSRMMVTDRTANCRPAVIIVASLIGTYVIVTYATLFRVPVYAVFLCLVAVAASVILYDQARPKAAIANLYTLRALVVGLIACVMLVGCFWVFWRITPTVFLGSDTIATWNNWSKEWAAGRFPILAYGYPQLAPAIWGSIYIWLGDSIQYGPTYLFILLLTLPPVAATLWSSERNPYLSLWMIAVYGTFVMHFRGWLGSSLVTSFPDWLVVSFVTTALVIAAPRLFDRPSSQSDDSLALITSQAYLCAAASIKPLAGLLSGALLISTALLGFRSARLDLNRSVVVQLLIVMLAVTTFITYYAQVINAVVLPPPKSATFMGQMMDGANFVAESVFPIFLILSVWGLATTAFSSRLWPFFVACAVGFAIWAHSASYDLRNVLPFLITSALFGVCGVASVTKNYEPLKHLTERLLVPADRQVTMSPVVTLLAFGIIVAAATFPLTKSDDEIRRAFLRDNQSIGLGNKINAMSIAAAKEGCWVGTNNMDLTYQDEMTKLPNNRLIWPNSLGVDETDIRAGLASNCWVLVVFPAWLPESTKQFLAAKEETGLLHRGSKDGWEIYASPTLPFSFPEQPF